MLSAETEVVVTRFSLITISLSFVLEPLMALTQLAYGKRVRAGG